jgi:hypothetical protein
MYNILVIPVRWISEGCHNVEGIGGSFFVVIKPDSLHHYGEVGEASEEQVTTNFGF